MGVIQCAENCKYQKDGYCTLEKPIAVNSVSGGCPYYIKNSFNESDCLGKLPYPDKLYGIGDGSNLLK